VKQIEVVIEPQYGKWVYYPACSDAKVFAEIAGTKTLTDATLVQIKKLGYEHDRVHQRSQEHDHVHG